MSALSLYEDTRFLNVDLDILSRRSLESLVAALGNKVFLHHVGREGKYYGAHFSLSGSYGKDADYLTYALAQLVLKLPRNARILWNQAQVRDFNIGIQSAFKPHSHTLRIKAKTLKLLSSLGANIIVTTYAPVIEHGTRKAGRRKRKNTVRKTKRR